MKRIIKSENSEVLRQDLKYKKGNNTNNAKIREILKEEQGGFCAYTEIPLSVGVAEDIEHFNENLKYTDGDGYHNWFVVSHKWNNRYKKSYKEPILLPSDEDIEERLKYNSDTGFYNYDEDDIAAKNLDYTIGLNIDLLWQARQNHIELIETIWDKRQDLLFWLNNPKTKTQLIKFRRAMETHFGIKF